MIRLRAAILTRYNSALSHGKMLHLANAVLMYLTKVRLDSRFAAFQVFLEMPKLVKSERRLPNGLQRALI